MNNRLEHCGADVKSNFEVFASDIRDPDGVKEVMKGCVRCCI